MLARIAAAAVVVAAVGMGGCCPKAEDRGLLLPAQPARVHLVALNGKARSIETLRARGTVEISWVDDKGNKHHETADGVLILRQRDMVAASGGSEPVGEVVLFGRVASQDIFELGENATNYWMAVRVDPKSALIGTKRSPRDPATSAALPIRAGKVPDILGISPLGAGDLPLVTTNLETVDVLVVREIPGVGGVTIDRGLSYSRYGAGDLETVRLYGPGGIIEGSATLSKYKDVALLPPDPDAPEKSSSERVRMPFRIEIVYPARQAQVILKLDSYELGVPLRDIAFKLPDFAKQGLKVEPVRPQPQ